ncbi:hypothetical protein HYW55_01810 [Candidatus Gottesmanbacteria bacterium]|nr:hypothetical protein [Candidatus Gottesmanbacteria bacterium]
MKKIQSASWRTKFRIQKGQVVLLLVLITVIGLTIGLSLISRTVTDVRISSQIEQSGRAFSAAEAGIESALRSGTSNVTSGNVSLPGASASYSVSPVSVSAATSYHLPLTATGKSQTLWLMAHDDATGALDESNYYDFTNGIDVCWGSDSSTVPALLVTLFYKDSTGDYSIAKAAFDANASTRGNGFSPLSLNEIPPGTYCQGGYSYRKSLTYSAFGLSGSLKAIALRMKPWYADTKIGVLPGASLPTQGNVITSLGQSETGVVRKIQVIQGYSALPEVFDFSYFSEN